MFIDLLCLSLVSSAIASILYLFEVYIYIFPAVSVPDAAVRAAAADSAGAYTPQGEAAALWG